MSPAADGSSSVHVCVPDDPGWLAFLAAQPGATLFHHPAWARVLSQTYGYRSLVLAQSDLDGRIVGGLPAVELRGLRGRRYVALPFTDHCPPLADSPVATQTLSRNLSAWRKATGARELVIRDALPAGPGIHLVSRGVRHTLPLAGGSQEILKRLQGGPVARAIRKAEREGVTARVSTSMADLSSFYRLHLATRRRLGVPIQPKRFLESIWRECLASGLGFAVVAGWRSHPVAAGLFLAWNGTLIYKFGASDPRYWNLRPNNLVIWAAIQWGTAHGFRWLDFGKSDLDNQGLRDFKSRWGATEIPLVHSHLSDAPPGPAPQLLRQALSRVIRTSPPIVCRGIGELLYGRAAGRFA